MGGNKISAIIGEYVTGYVDVTKEDVVFDINAGIQYSHIHMLWLTLIRMGSGIFTPPSRKIQIAPEGLNFKLRKFVIFN